MNLNTSITKAVKKQREDAVAEPIHADFAPVRNYADYISGVTGKNHLVVTIPAGSAAHGMGYRTMATQAELNVTAAVWDDSGWVLSSEATECIEQWPSDWPETVTGDFLRRRGVAVVVSY